MKKNAPPPSVAHRKEMRHPAPAGPRRPSRLHPSCKTSALGTLPWAGPHSLRCLISLDGGPGQSLSAEGPTRWRVHPRTVLSGPAPSLGLPMKMTTTPSDVGPISRLRRVIRKKPPVYAGRRRTAMRRIQPADPWLATAYARSSTRPMPRTEGPYRSTRVPPTHHRRRRTTTPCARQIRYEMGR